MKKTFFFILTLILITSLYSQIISNSQRLADVEKMLQEQQDMLGNRAYKPFGFLENKLTVNEMQAMKFLYAYMPLSDLADYDNHFFLKNVQYSLKALKEIPWVKTVPEDEFLHFVLPLRVNNENLDSFRIVCYEELKARVLGLSMYDAALEVNHWCHEKVTYQASDERTSSPLSTMKYSLGRCGEESVFTVTALRTVGIPARQVYTPRWAHSDDNHAWVEVWIDGKWYFMGACEPDPELNMGWFTFPASRTMIVHTRAYGKYFGNEEIMTEEKRFSELNLIQNYADTRIIHVKVSDSKGNPIEGARVNYLLYNYAEFYPIASGMTNEDGMSSVRLGLGEIIVWGFNGQYLDFKKVPVSNTDTVRLVLSETHPQPMALDLDFTPPTGRFLEVYSGEKAEINRKRLIYEDSIRTEYMSSFKDNEEARNIAIEFGYDPEIASKLLVKSFGNWKEISAFLAGVSKENHKYAIQLLSVISEKDLRDVQASILLGHLEKTLELESVWAQKDSAMFVNYILNPRIDNELLSPWRKCLRDEINIEFYGKEITPTVLELWVKENILLEKTANLHSRAPLTPRGILHLRMSDARSLNIFFVALCRSYGFPARLHPETRIPQYFFADMWNNVWFENMQEATAQETSTIVFKNPNKSKTDKYFNTFTVAKLQNGYYKTLEYPYDQPLSELENKPQEVFAGHYLLITGNRLGDGSVMSRLTFFDAEPDATIEVNVTQRTIQESKQKSAKVKLKNFKLPDFETNAEILLKDHMSSQGMLLIFIDPDKEPSKHVMHDIALVTTQLEESNISIFYIISPDMLSPSFTANTFKGLPKQGKYLIDHNRVLFNEMTKNKSNTPLPVVYLLSNKQKVLFFSEGYRIGTGDEILRILDL